MNDLVLEMLKTCPHSTSEIAAKLSKPAAATFSILRSLHKMGRVTQQKTSGGIIWSTAPTASTASKLKEETVSPPFSIGDTIIWLHTNQVCTVNDVSRLNVGTVGVKSGNKAHPVTWLKTDWVKAHSSVRLR